MGEIQRDVKFEDIEVGDLIVMEIFSPDNLSFFGDRRGTATRRDGDVWHFDGMLALHKNSMVNYRLFRVEPPSELEKLRKLKKRVEGMIAEKRTELAGKKVDAERCVEKGWDEGHERLVHEINEVFAVKKALEKVLNG